MITGWRRASNLGLDGGETGLGGAYAIFGIEGFLTGGVYISENNAPVNTLSGTPVLILQRRSRRQQICIIRKMDLRSVGWGP